MLEGPAGAAMEAGVAAAKPVSQEAVPVKPAPEFSKGTKSVFTEANLPKPNKDDTDHDMLRQIAEGDNGQKKSEKNKTKSSKEISEKKDVILKQRTETVKNQLREKYQARLDSDPKLKKSIDYLLESKDKKGITPLEQITSIYNNLENADNNLVLSQIQQVAELAIAQQQQNPEQYVSHGFDHTLNVLRDTRTIIENNPQLIESMVKKYNIDTNEARFMMEMVAVAHDFGYPDSEGKGLGKAAHAVTGAEIADKFDFSGLIKNTNVELKTDFRDAVLFHGADKVETYFDSKIKTTKGEFLVSEDNILTVISEFQKGGDQVEQISINIKDQQTKNNFLGVLTKAGVDPSFIKFVDSPFGGRYVDLLKKNQGQTEVVKKTIGLEFHQVDLNDSPLAGVIRVADNMDMTQDRFSEVQRTPAFQEIYRKLGASNIPDAVIYQELVTMSREQNDLSRDQIVERVKQKLTQKTDNDQKAALESITSLQNVLSTETDPTIDRKKLSDTWKTKIVDQVLLEHQGKIDPNMEDNVRKIGLMQNEQSYWHFGGCEAVKDVQLEGSTIGITVDEEKMTELNKSSAEDNDNGEKVKIPVGLYQVWRMSAAYSSIKAGDQPMDIIVQYADKDGKITKLESYKNISGRGFVNILE